ncbi:CLUMA_CG012220, isoform A [Clunio marinus]|uniref:CLUMA_CG012220, isoform A n=1 Tax=Clunio marinus TaxID=568069 RepID=A0A1J1IEI4_9DIPT|nr:CLUMA_CG012220, isoform A [Clunio marinus]
MVNKQTTSLSPTCSHFITEFIEHPNLCWKTQKTKEKKAIKHENYRSGKDSL